MSKNIIFFTGGARGDFLNLVLSDCIANPKFTNAGAELGGNTPETPNLIFTNQVVGYSTPKVVELINNETDIANKIFIQVQKEWVWANYRFIKRKGNRRAPISYNTFDKTIEKKKIRLEYIKQIEHSISSSIEVQNFMLNDSGIEWDYKISFEDLYNLDVVSKLYENINGKKMTDEYKNLVDENIKLDLKLNYYKNCPNPKFVAVLEEMQKKL